MAANPAVGHGSLERWPSSAEDIRLALARCQERDVSAGLASARHARIPPLALESYDEISLPDGGYAGRAFVATGVGVCRGRSGLLRQSAETAGRSGARGRNQHRG